MDLQLEYMNRVMKESIKNLGSNKSHVGIERVEML